MTDYNLSPDLGPLMDPIVVALGSGSPEFIQLIDRLTESGLIVQQCDELNDLLGALREHVINLILLECDKNQPAILQLVALIRDNAADIPIVMANKSKCQLESPWIVAGVQWIFPIQISSEELWPALKELIQRNERLRVAEATTKRLQSQISSEHERVNRFGHSFGELNHELNTPLAVIQGYCANLRDGILGQLSEDQQNSIERIHFACNLMKGVVGRIKEELPRPKEAPKQWTDPRSNQRRQIRIAMLIQEVAALFEQSFAAKGSSLVLEVDHKVHPIWADRGRISQLLVNLLSNAQRHMPAGESTVVTVSTADDAGQESCLITVHNPGPAIPAEHLEEIFRPGWSKTADPPGQRAGLGLAICKEIAKEHRARLWVESTHDKGTSFHLMLPADPRSRRREVVVHLVQDETLSGQLLLELKKLGVLQLKKPPSMEVLAKQIHESGLPLVLFGAAKQGLHRVLKYLEQ